VEFVNQFKPISLCNIDYKVLFEVVVNRLKPLMSSLISPFQMDFILKRSIRENVVVAQELLHSIRRMQGKVGFFVL